MGYKVSQEAVRAQRYTGVFRLEIGYNQLLLGTNKVARETWHQPPAAMGP